MNKKTKNNRVTCFALKYEFLNTLYNGYAFFFGAVFPVLLLLLITKGIATDVPKEFQGEVFTSIFLGMAMIVPLATVFLSYGSTYANELEKEVPTRMNLFGFNQRSILISKMVANFAFLTMCLIIYFVVSMLLIDIKAPTAIALLVFIVVIYIMSTELMVLAHGIANLLRKFGSSYGVLMALYFIMMALSGLMGIKVENLPLVARKVSDFLPMKYASAEYIDYWLGKDYNFGPMIQSFIFFGALSLIILLFSFRYRARKE